MRRPLRPALPLLVVALAALLAGCDAPRPVQLAIGDAQLAGLYWEPAKRLSPAVLILPAPGQGKEAWIPLATRLRKAGNGVLALELREPGSARRDELLADVAAGFQFLREQKKVDAARIGLLGADLGANAALAFAAREPLARTVALVSPGPDYAKLPSEPPMGDYGARALFLAAAEEDAGSARTVRRLAETALGPATTRFYPGAMPGRELAGSPGLAEDLLAFLRAQL